MYNPKKCCKDIRGNKGFLMVEAALIWPLIMLVIMFILYLTFNLYRQACSFAVLNFAAESYDRYPSLWISREAAENYSETQELISHYNREFLLPESTPCLDKSGNLLFPKIKISQEETYSMVLLQGIGKAGRLKENQSESYILREAQRINRADVFKENL